MPSLEELDNRVKQLEDKVTIQAQQILQNKQNRKRAITELETLLVERGVIKQGDIARGGRRNKKIRRKTKRKRKTK